jgi:hypothetical protein
MSKARHRIVIFCSVVAAISILVQSPKLPVILDSALGGVSWSKGIVNFLKSQTQGLLLLIWLSLYLEFIGLEKSKDRERKEKEELFNLLEIALKASSPAVLFRQSLESQYGEEALAQQLTGSIIRPTPILKNFRVRSKVTRSSNKNFNIELTYNYEAKIPRYIVALTDEPLQAEALLSTGKFAEVFIVQKTINNSPILPFTVKCYRKTQDRVELLGNLNFSKLSNDEKKKLFTGTAELFEGKIDRVHLIKPTDTIQYTVVYTNIQESRYPYTFWLSDRVLYLSHVEVDLSALGQEVYNLARIHFFMATVESVAKETPSDGVWFFNLDKWLVNGQGFIVFWPS